MERAFRINAQGEIVICFEEMTQAAGDGGFLYWIIAHAIVEDFLEEG